MMAVRARYLQTSALGRRLIAFYEAIAPSMARVLDEHPRLKGPVRLFLTPLVAVCRFLINFASQNLLVDHLLRGRDGQGFIAQFQPRSSSKSCDMV
jgi:hypothetical protein